MIKRWGTHTEKKKKKKYYNVEEYLDQKDFFYFAYFVINYLKSANFFFKWTPALSRNFFPSSSLILAHSFATILSE